MLQIDRLTPQKSPLSSSWKLYQPHHVSYILYMIPPSSPVSPRVSLGLRPLGFLHLLLWKLPDIVHKEDLLRTYGARMKGCNKASSCYIPTESRGAMS